ncbi:uncharacterized protein LOC123531513 isoform X1 [Mercenaria mercenaria]|uniref:uncharacterized protein LOC123531513 isoform X1 n=1 Tax=Mercenaria mercenaria TaxID=6596 RepID=UPI00234EE656|nr:uncharacterized protein LOC123531513 isoform X1 [Mercenaria mercenaria]
MNNQGNFPNTGMRPTLNQGQMSGQNMQQQQQQQQMVMMEQMMNSGNANPMLGLFQSNMHGMNQQQRAMFFENFQRNFQMMQQQSNSNMPLQQQGIMGNGNARMLNMMQEAMRMQGNSQAQSMMGQPQGIMGNGNSQVMNMQQSLIGQQGSVMSTQQGLCGHQQTMSGQQQQPQTHQVVGGIQRQMVSQGQPQQASGGRASTMSSVGQSQQSRVKSQGILISGNPAVYTQNTGQGSQSTTTKSELIKNVNELSKIRGILKNTQSVSAAPSSKVSTSEKQSLSSTQWKSDKLKDMLKTYFYPSEDDETSAEDSVQKQTDTLSQGNMQTVHSSTSNSKTSPLQRRTMASCAKQVVNITNSRTGGPSSGVSTANRGQLNPVSKTSTLQTKSSTVTSQSAQRSKVEGQSIPTLVSSGLRKQKDQPMKRKADTEIGTEVKKSKVTAQQTARVPTEVEDEDPEYVQAQVFISKIPNETTKGMILDILQHYNFTSPKVWIGRHNSRKDQICAFVKLPSLKDSKRVIAEMKGFPYKGREMEIRFSAAADFIDYTVPSDGVSQSRVAGVQQPAPIIDTRNPPPGSSQPPAATALHVANTGIPPPTMLHPLPGSAIPVETVPTMIPAPVSVAPVAYPTVAVPVYAGVPPPAQNIYTTPVAYRIESTDKPYLDRGSYQRDYRRSLSPRDRRGYSPQYSSHRDRYPSPYGSSSRDRRLSPDYSSRGRHSSPGYSPHRRYSRSPDYHSLSPDRQAYRRSRSRSPYDSHSRERGYYSPTRGRSLTPDYTSRHRSGYENSPLDDRYSQRSQESSFDYTAGRDRRSSLPSDGRYRDSPYRGRSQERSQEVPNIETHGLSDIYCVHIENLPADIKDSELEGLIEAFLYNSVRLKVRDGKATADIVVSSITEAKIMMQQLDGRRFMGAKLQVDWYREAPVTESEERIDSRPIFTRSPDLRESVRTADSRSGTGYSDRERPGRSVDRDHSVRSLERDHSRRSLERDLSRRSADRERSRRSPDRDKSTRSGDKYPAWDKRDRFKDADKSLFQSYIDSSYPNAPVLGRKYIKEFSSKGSSTAYYLCVLCEMTLTWRNIADHMMGYKHRLKCIKRSHPKIYDKICLIQSKVDMLGQCAKYALELENKQELINRIETPHPESSASQHLKRIKEAETTEKDKRYDKKRAEDRTSGRKKEDEKKDENSPDSTSDIFKKIEAYKKKFEASKDTSGEGDSGEPQAKKPRTDEREKSGMSFKDLTKQNKTLADSIQKGIESARKGAEQKKTTSVRKIDWKKEITAAKKRIEESKKFQAEIDAKAEANRNEQEVSKDIAQEERKDANKVSPVSSKAKNEQVIQKLTKESQGKQGEGKPRSANEMVGESKNVNTKVCEAKSLNVKTINEKVCDSKNRISTIGKVNDSEKTVTVAKTKPDIENKKVSKEEEQGLSENDKGKSKNINKRDDDAEELTIDPEDIEDLGKSISAELFGEELGNMEDEEVVEEKSEPAKGKMSNHPLSKLQKYFDMQLLKDPESSGIVGMQYVIEAIPFKASKAHVYKCTLCSVKCATTSIVDHILGYKHRMKYFEIHNFDIYSIIMKMDQSRKFLNAECTKYAKSIQEKEGVKTVMTLTDEEFKQREKIFNKTEEVDEPIGRQPCRIEIETGGNFEDLSSTSTSLVPENSYLFQSTTQIAYQPNDAMFAACNSAYSNMEDTQNNETDGSVSVGIHYPEKFNDFYSPFISSENFQLGYSSLTSSHSLPTFVRDNASKHGPVAGQWIGNPASIQIIGNPTASPMYKSPASSQIFGSFATTQIFNKPATIQMFDKSATCQMFANSEASNITVIPTDKQAHQIKSVHHKAHVSNLNKLPFSHEERTLRPLEYKCPVKKCPSNEDFKGHCAFMRHWNSKHIQYKKKFICNKCKKIFDQKKLMLKHIKRICHSTFTEMCAKNQNFIDPGKAQTCTTEQLGQANNAMSNMEEKHIFTELELLSDADEYSKGRIGMAEYTHEDKGCPSFFAGAKCPVRECAAIDGFPTFASFRIHWEFAHIPEIHTYGCLKCKKKMFTLKKVLEHKSWCKSEIEKVVRPNAKFVDPNGELPFLSSKSESNEDQSKLEEDSAEKAIEQLREIESTVDKARDLPKKQSDASKKTIGLNEFLKQNVKKQDANSPVFYSGAKCTVTNCRSTFITLDEFVEHWKMCHCAVYLQQYSCDKCGRRCTWKPGQPVPEVCSKVCSGLMQNIIYEPLGSFTDPGNAKPYGKIVPEEVIVQYGLTSSELNKLLLGCSSVGKYYKSHELSSLLFHAGAKCPVSGCNVTFANCSFFLYHWKNSHLPYVKRFLCTYCNSMLKTVKGVYCCGKKSRFTVLVPNEIFIDPVGAILYKISELDTDDTCPVFVSGSKCLVKKCNIKFLNYEQFLRHWICSHCSNFEKYTCLNCKKSYTRIGFQILYCKETRCNGPVEGPSFIPNQKYINPGNVKPYVLKDDDVLSSGKHGNKYENKVTLATFLSGKSQEAVNISGDNNNVSEPEKDPEPQNMCRKEIDNTYILSGSKEGKEMKLRTELPKEFNEVEANSNYLHYLPEELINKGPNIATGAKTKTIQSEISGNIQVSLKGVLNEAMKTDQDESEGKQLNMELPLKNFRQNPKTKEDVEQMLDEFPKKGLYYDKKLHPPEVRFYINAKCQVKDCQVVFENYSQFFAHWRKVHLPFIRSFDCSKCHFKYEIRKNYCQCGGKVNGPVLVPNTEYVDPRDAELYRIPFHNDDSSCKQYMVGGECIAEKCQETFRSHSQFAKHWMNKHCPNFEKYTCMKCTKSFYRKFNFLLNCPKPKCQGIMKGPVHVPNPDYIDPGNVKPTFLDRLDREQHEVVSIEGISKDTKLAEKLDDVNCETDKKTEYVESICGKKFDDLEIVKETDSHLEVSAITTAKSQEEKYKSVDTFSSQIGRKRLEEVDNERATVISGGDEKGVWQDNVHSKAETNSYGENTDIHTVKTQNQTAQPAGCSSNDQYEQPTGKLYSRPDVENEGEIENILNEEPAGASETAESFCERQKGPEFYPGAICVVENCLASFSSYSQFRRHWDQTHIGYLKQTFCAKCNKPFKVRQHGLKHLKNEHCEGPLKYVKVPNKNFVYPGIVLPYRRR